MLPSPLVEHAVEIEVLPAPRWHVVLLDDDDHTYPYVVEMLQRLFRRSEAEAWAMAREVDSTGRVVVWTGPREHAEFKQGQIHGFGADPRVRRCCGSMSADIEPAD